MRTAMIIVMIVVPLTSAGCIPVQLTDVIATDGFVNDRDTRQPIDAAKVDIVVNGKTRQSTRTGADGHFTVDRQTSTWWRPLLPIPMDPALPKVHAVASKDGYESADIVFQYGERKTPGDVLLARAADGTSPSTKPEP